MNIIELKNISFKNNTTSIFSNLNLTLKKNSFISIIGSNNSGKTTLLKILCGDIYTDNIFYNEERIVNSNILKDNVCYVSKSNVFYSKTIMDELNLHSQNLYDINYLLKYFDLWNYKDKTLSNLSNEKLITLNLIITLLKNPKLILLDNLFSSFSKDKKNDILKKIKEYTLKKEIAVVYTSNNVNDCLFFDDFYFIENNELTKNLYHTNLTLPFIIELSEKLKLYNLINEDIFDIDKLVEML